MVENLHKGWCPGALAPMLSGDGYIFRLRLTNGVLSFERAKILAELARRYGNGAFDLSARANLQMRGVSAENVTSLQEAFLDLDLLDDNPRAESVRNVVPSPLAGFDPTALIDARPFAAALEELLTRENSLWRLPPKFGFSIDGGGCLPLDGVATDVDFSAVAATPSPLFSVALGGADAGLVDAKNLIATAEILARNFLRLRGEARRMSALVQRIGVTPLLEDALVIASEAKQSMAKPKSRVDCFVAFAHRNDCANYSKILGAQNCGGENFVGAGMLFGRIEAAELEALATEAESCGATELRLTPWRAILAVGLSNEGAGELAAHLGRLSFLLDADDPRLAFSACPGAPACNSALADVRATALALAPFWRANAGRVHVSGCVKGCAHNAPALTLVAETSGFCLVEEGYARSAPDRRGLDVAALQERLTTLAGERVLERL